MGVNFMEECTMQKNHIQLQRNKLRSIVLTPAVLLGLLLWFCGLAMADLDKRSFYDDMGGECGAVEYAQYGSSVALGDIDNDGFDDLIVTARYSGYKGTYIHYGSVHGGLSYANFIDNDPSSQSTVATADINNDGFADIILRNYSEITVYFGGGWAHVGSGTVTPPYWTTSLGTGGVSKVTAAGDVNGDGIDDFAVGSESSNTAYVIYGFNPAVATEPDGPYSILYADFVRYDGNAGDVNGDGYTDVIKTLAGTTTVVVETGSPSRKILGWGKNTNGKLGDGTTEDRLFPVFADTTMNFTTVAAGNQYSIAISQRPYGGPGGYLYSWGNGTHFELGNGSNTNPVHSPSTTGYSGLVTAISTGEYHGLLLNNTELFSWGHNGAGQLGRDGGGGLPTVVPPYINWSAIAGGEYHSLGIHTDGTLWGWGWNFFGQVGDGTYESRLIPTLIGSDSDWLTVAAGQYHSLALKTDGSLWTWGSNWFGQLGNGNGNQEPVTQPERIGSDSDWLMIEAGWTHNLAIKTDGSLWAWGWNQSAQLGNGGGEDLLSPTRIGNDNDWVAIAGGYIHSMALKSDGTRWAWGGGNWGQLGSGLLDSYQTPTQMGSENDWEVISAGYDHSLGIRATDKYVWSVDGSTGNTSAYFGDVVGGVGDINGDGYDEIIITDPWYDPCSSTGSCHPGNWGRVHIWYGGPPTTEDPSGLGLNQTPGTADIILSGGIANGASRSYASGDTNGDGFSDLVLGDSRAAGPCFIYPSGQGFVEMGTVMYYTSDFAPDADNDDISDPQDNCPNTSNINQQDLDSDGLGDVCDNCPNVLNGPELGSCYDYYTQEVGESCTENGNCGSVWYLWCDNFHGDGDSDGVGDVCDNCPLNCNSQQSDADGDGIGDVCDDTTGCDGCSSICEIEC
jgi:alpha-tubulin suppressor-like RCC1 family protein